jgi:branched-chain amino acid transport system permease protein
MKIIDFIKHNKLAAGLIIVLAFSVSPIFLNRYMVLVLDLGILAAMTVLGLVVLVGFTGQLSLGQVAYFAIGGYVAGFACTRWGIDPWIAIILAAVVSALFGVLIGFPAFKLNGPFLAIITIGFFEIVKILLVNLIDITGGPYGMAGIPPLKIGELRLNRPLLFFYFSIFILLVFIVFILRLRKSRIGRAMISVMNDEVVSPMLGVNVRRIKLTSFGIASFITGLAGAFYAVLTGYIVPDAYTFSESALYLSMAVVSGFNVIIAPMVAIILNMLPEALRGLQEYYLLIFSIALLTFILISAWRQYKLNNER